MQVISKRMLRLFWEKHARAEVPLKVWFRSVTSATWSTPSDIKAQFGTADFLGDYRVIFDIGGNKYRLVVRVSYTFKRVLIKFVGTHAEYDKIDAESVG